MSDNKTESQLSEITQFIPSQPLRMRRFGGAIKQYPHPEEHRGEAAVRLEGRLGRCSLVLTAAPCAGRKR
ncbi:MAG TPA: hypothetical protein VKS43_14760, partial [Burkholderiales bacterium]|nr:hypothetical protein [Burkholderiales bacterium]